jgi:predicted DNA-binding transcriptional regulator AlpA
MMAPQDRTLISALEVCRILDVSSRTIEDWRRKGFGPPAFKIGGQWRYDSIDLQNWIDKQKKGKQ